MERREFLRRAGLTGLAMVGAAGGAAWLYDPRGGDEYFRDQQQVQVRKLPSYRVERPGAVELAIARGSDAGQLARAAIGALGGIESFVKKLKKAEGFADIHCISPLLSKKN